MSKKPNEAYEEVKKLVDKHDDELEISREDNERKRPSRKTTYERVSETHIPKDVKEKFLKDDWELRWVRWMIGGEEDYRNLGRRMNEGYEFVTEKELPQSFLMRLRLVNTRAQKGLVTSGDVCLMKADTKLVESRRRTYENRTDLEVNTADIFTVAKKKGFKDLGSKTKITYKDPRGFQD